jgi:hypothetical protein
MTFTVIYQISLLHIIRNKQFRKLTDEVGRTVAVT